MSHKNEDGASSTEKHVKAVKEFWNDQAREHGANLAATTPDPIAKDLEIAALKRHLKNDVETLEIGCGNGTNLFRLSDHLNGRLKGIDYAEEMVGAAVEALTSRSKEDQSRMVFETGDIMQPLDEHGLFSQIFTVRCLINLPSIEHQLAALGNINRILKPGGRLVLVESVKQGQEKLNSMRTAIGLDPIPYHWHNLYLDQQAFLAGVPKDLELVEIDNFASLYFVISRVFNAKLTPPGQNPDYLAEINQIAGQVESMGDHAPLKLFHFEKRSGT